jgi:uncharacterized protein (UPF0276 family)
MSTRLGVGLPLYSDLEYLELARELIEEEADFFEVNPETLWRSEQGALVRNDYHALFQEIRRRSGKPFVAHGLAFSLGSPVDGDQPRTDAWVERLRDDQDSFRFEWLTEHLGWTQVDGLQATLPLPLPFHEESVRAVAARMRLLGSVVPHVGFENNADYFCLGEPGDWPDFINTLCRASSCGLLLDLHNLYTQCLNFKQDPVETLDRLDADAVLEIHLSGGSESDPGWLPSGRVFRLDSHDGPIPEPVWALAERALPRCRNLRGVTVERLNGTFSAAEVPAIRAELRRAKELFPC